MAANLKSFEFTPIPESEQLRFRFQLRETPQQVEFLVPAHAMTTLIDALQLAQERYTRARDQYIQRRKKKIRLVRDDDV